MNKKLSSFSIILGFICLSIVGIALVPLLPVKLSPSATLPRINVSFNMRDASARVVEIEVTSRLEAMLNRMKGVSGISSTSGNGWGRISIQFDKHTDMEMARFETSTIIRQIWPSLAETVSYPSISMSRSDDNAAKPFLTYTINAPSNASQIQQFAENQIKTRLAQIEGVNKINVSGAMPMHWQLIYDNDRLQVLGVSVNDIQSAINQYLNKEFLGIVSIEKSKGKKEWIRLAIVPEESEVLKLQVSDIPVANKDGKMITLDELVEVNYLEEEADSYYRINGLNSVYMSIAAEETANQLEVSKKIKAELENLKSGFPPGYEIHLSYDSTEYIHKELDKVYFRAGLTLFILLIFVLIIYRSWKYLLLISVSLFVNIAVAVIFYYFLQLEIQLYSLAGITISLTLILDNTIVMSDQIIRQKNMKAFLAILTATLTTIASLVIIFFLDEKIRLNLQDFALVLIINLAISLLIALFLVPALIDKLNIKRKKKQRKKKNRTLLRSGSLLKRKKRIGVRFVLFFNRLYALFCKFVWRWRIAFIVAIILAFGLPVFLLPDKLEGEDKKAEFYNKTLGSVFYKEKIKPYSDKILGGTLRLFVEKVYNGSYFTDREETSLYISATLPNGATVSQMDNLVRRMETYISEFPEVRQFQTSINNARRASIQVYFTKEALKSSFPYTLKSKLISRSQELGGGSWGVYGFGDGFSNDVRESAGSYQVNIYGFNYDELTALAENFKNKLLGHRRIKEVLINSEFSWYKDDYQEFHFDLNREYLAYENIQPYQLYSSINSIYGRNIYAGRLPGKNGSESIILKSLQSDIYDIWSLENVHAKIRDKSFKMGELSTITMEQAPQQIVKENQQYRLCIQYEYIGAHEQGKRVLERNIEEFRKDLPLGYSIENVQRYWSWKESGNKQYALLLLIFVIIFFTSSVLFNSIKQPWYVIFVIPISYIGIFLTFYLFKLNFDQGGFASFILLCGISVNANIYILNEYNNIRKKRNISPLKAYLKAWNAKITPIMLTVLSTILGFIPFMIGEGKEAFWFPLAVGTIGGMIVSLFGMFCYLPLFMGIGRKLRVKN